MSITNSELFIGKTACLQRVFTEDDLRKCKELTNDNNLIYQGNTEDWKKRFSRPIVPALLVEGLISQVITNKLPGCACLLVQKEMVYYHPVHVGDAITAELLIMDINHERDWITQKVTCFNQKGTEVTKGQVVIYVLPGA
jgi:3-hydroxybutyryl-CoA dehydratase